MLFTILLAGPFTAILSDHIRERFEAFTDLRFELGQTVGEHIGILGPELVIPIEGGPSQIILKPAIAEIDIDQVGRKVSADGVTVPYHESEVVIRMRFAAVDWTEYLNAGESLDWANAQFRIRVGAPKSIRDYVVLEANGRETRLRKELNIHKRLSYTTRAPRDLNDWVEENLQG